MAVKQVIKRKVAMASLRADDAFGNPSIHSIKYRRMDGVARFKRHVSKSFRHLPGASKYRGNMNAAHEFLFVDHDEPDPEKKHFRIKIDLLVEVDGNIIDHTNGEYAATRN